MELISKVSVEPDHKKSFPVSIRQYLEGKHSIDWFIAKARMFPKEYVQQFIDEVNGEAALYSVGMTGIPQDDEKATRLFHLAEMLEKEL